MFHMTLELDVPHVTGCGMDNFRKLYSEVINNPEFRETQKFRISYLQFYQYVTITTSMFKTDRLIFLVY